ncbi:MAG: metallopeptidase family protein [Tannerella sp.]
MIREARHRHLLRRAVRALRQHNAERLSPIDGVPLTERDDAWSVVLPDRILIFKGPLERWCANREELTAEIGVTVIHEVAHHFGIDDDRLHELGWE